MKDYRLVMVLDKMMFISMCISVFHLFLFSSVDCCISN